MRICAVAHAQLYCLLGVGFTLIRQQTIIASLGIGLDYTGNMELLRLASVLFFLLAKLMSVEGQGGSSCVTKVCVVWKLDTCSVILCSVDREQSSA